MQMSKVKEQLSPLSHFFYTVSTAERTSREPDDPETAIIPCSKDRGDIGTNHIFVLAFVLE